MIEVYTEKNNIHEKGENILEVVQCKYISINEGWCIIYDTIMIENV